MRKFIMGCLGVVAAVTAIQFAQAEVKAGLFDRFSACSPCEAACDPCDAACDVGCGSGSGWFIGGHMEAGVYANEYGNTDWTDSWGETYPGNTWLLQNVRNTGGQLNQGVIYAGKKANGRKGWDFGGRVDFMFGTDAYYAQSQGLEYGTGHWDYADDNHRGGRWGTGDYYSALSQVYFEAEYKKLNIKVGKFLTPLGHEGLYSTDRFFYSLSDAFGMRPVTQSGALFTYNVNKKLTVYGGWVQGDDTFFDSSNDNAFLGGLSYEFSKRAYFKYGALIGRDTRAYDNNYYNNDKKDRDYFVQSFIVGYKPGKRWDYTFEWTLRNEKNEAVYYGNPDIFYEGAYGINQELIYRINKKWAVGLRAEWSHYYDANHWTWDGEAQHSSWGVDKYTFTLAANWNPRTWITIRPEMRYDKFDGRYDYFEEKGVDGKDRNKQLSGGISAIVKF